MKKSGKITAIITLVSVAAVAVFVVLMIKAGAREATVAITDGALTISGMYGRSVERAQIESVELLETPPKFTARTNGAAVGNIRKGNFTAEELGAVVAFVHTDSVPWILIKGGDKPLLLGLATPEETRTLYREIAEWLKIPA